MRAYEETAKTIKERVKELNKKKEEMYNEIREEITKLYDGKVFKRVTSYDSDEFIVCGKGIVYEERGDIKVKVEIACVYLYDDKLEISNGSYSLDTIKGSYCTESTTEELKEFIKENTIDYLKELGLE